jgi:hypothetical protein
MESQFCELLCFCKWPLQLFWQWLTSWTQRNLKSEGPVSCLRFKTDSSVMGHLHSHMVAALVYFITIHLLLRLFIAQWGTVFILWIR